MTRRVVSLSVVLLTVAVRAPAQSILFVEDYVILRVRPGGKVRRLLP